MKIEKERCRSTPLGGFKFVIGSHVILTWLFSGKVVTH
jgi:hypothetical protein